MANWKPALACAVGVVGCLVRGLHADLALRVRIFRGLPQGVCLVSCFHSSLNCCQPRRRSEPRPRLPCHFVTRPFAGQAGGYGVLHHGHRHSDGGVARIAARASFISS